MFARVTLTALAAGVIAGVFLWAAHMVLTTPLIQAAEVYESASAHAAAPGHAASEHGQAASEDDFRRHGLTLLMDVLTGVGFAFILSGLLSLTNLAVDWRNGLLWGLGGFAAFFIAPSLGLPPKLPGMETASLDMRQVWWLATAAATVAGLGLIFLSGTAVLRAAGVVLIVLPQVVGAPGMESAFEPGGVPAELAARFVIATTVATGLFWMVLGAFSGYFYNRFDQNRDYDNG
ncbi:MAG: CbtA family protein [Alphaproteobacteria bacterium]|nr:CbtA family protein [Alphaproteobacteria bacterium]